MCKYELDRIIIGEKQLDRLTDEDNIHWYPLKMFLTNILCKYDKVSSFRDSSINRYMKIIEYNPNRTGAKRPIKMWCINENGIKYLLKKMSVVKLHKTRMYNARKKGLYEACLYFNVKNSEIDDPTFINQQPNIDNYDIWSLLCIQYDKHLNYYTKWKICPKCGYYYPYKERYFGKNKNKDSNCLQCQNKNFECQNKIIQYIYDNDGFDLLYKLHIDNNDRDIINELKHFIDKG